MTAGSERDRDEWRLAVELTAVANAFARRLRNAASGDGLTPTQRAALHRVEESEPLTVAALARVEMVRPQSMRTTVAVLLEEGLLARSPHPTDRRQIMLSLTDLGRTTLREMRRAKQDWLADALATRLDAAERRTLAEATDLLTRLTKE